MKSLKSQSNLDFRFFRQNVVSFVLFRFSRFLRLFLAFSNCEKIVKVCLDSSKVVQISLQFDEFLQSFSLLEKKFVKMKCVNLFCTWQTTTFDGFFIKSVIEGLLFSSSVADSGFMMGSPYSSVSSIWGGVDSSPLDSNELGTLKDSPNIGGGMRSFSCTIRPPRRDVFSTDKAWDMPCSFRPKPRPCCKNE